MTKIIVDQTIVVNQKCFRLKKAFDRKKRVFFDQNKKEFLTKKDKVYSLVIIQTKKKKKCFSNSCTIIPTAHSLRIPTRLGYSV